ncbi:flagellar biosynthesis protein FlgN [Campylobacter sp. RM9344]|uniref:Flagellar biosynthesis protein FlgN n=1 Tax=Campylobacter californiensis TaxID=1032243 RepID=A0AAW3ZWI9_9BACT|nr:MULTISPECIES: flagellar biosynthesis protein FlgN [unclassified Campylobacter]MBE2983760.1 flagellar biosynthesis protein FlgN [Campylobacter sp. RM6883]MBE2985676.1 flagellar biosynthesis protein FlgN [Campylobacter sp. RM12919]MBE2987295.1 flagellar biosynthesis protein FlgN [Campylobacter sp. RM12920]MBE2994299.1 flagellar biosynthesis protein FlgN [Campylobacter sp. RM6913]MBE3028607.1 flagellar biosynthesis protein FlgN [Campylobacter sp. RM9344]
MLKRYLDEAIASLEELIKATVQDIENIKEAKHSTVDESVKKKLSLVREFETTKKALDKELVKVSKENNTTALANVLDDEVKSKLVLMRSKLEELHVKNKEYARHVVVVKEFFDSLNKQIFGQNSNEYSSTNNSNNLYKTRV